MMTEPTIEKLRALKALGASTYRVMNRRRTHWMQAKLLASAMQYECIMNDLGVEDG